MFITIDFNCSQIWLEKLLYAVNTTQGRDHWSKWLVYEGYGGDPGIESWWEQENHSFLIPLANGSFSGPMDDHMPTCI